MTEHLSDNECWALLTRTEIGRLAVVVDDGVNIFPVNYLARDGAIYFRTAPGSKLMDVATNPAVAFEIDGKRRGRQWSVVVRGAASRLDRDDEIEASGVLNLHTQTPAVKDNFVRITPSSVSGRRV